jgi:hypothetical protein
MLTKRTIQLGGYDTASHGWTLSGLEFVEPAPMTNLVEVPGRLKGALDLSLALTGEPIYSTRDLRVVLETSSGDRQNREARIADLTNSLHGRRVEIILPDSPNYYAVGQLVVTKLFNNHAHGSVEILGICEPWLYALRDTVVEVQASATEQTVELVNQGALSLVPDLEVIGGSVTLGYNSATQALSAGTYKWPHLYLTPGVHSVTYSGSGAVRFTYREAVIR